MSWSVGQTVAGTPLGASLYLIDKHEFYRFTPGNPPYVLKIRTTDFTIESSTQTMSGLTNPILAYDNGKIILAGESSPGVLTLIEIGGGVKSVTIPFSTGLGRFYLFKVKERYHLIARSAQNRISLYEFTKPLNEANDNDVKLVTHLFNDVNVPTSCPGPGFPPDLVALPPIVFNKQVWLSAYNLCHNRLVQQRTPTVGVLLYDPVEEKFSSLRGEAVIPPVEADNVYSISFPSTISPRYVHTVTVYPTGSGYIGMHWTGNGLVNNTSQDIGMTIYYTQNLTPFAYSHATSVSPIHLPQVPGGPADLLYYVSGTAMTGSGVFRIKLDTVAESALTFHGATSGGARTIMTLVASNDFAIYATPLMNANHNTAIIPAWWYERRYRRGPSGISVTSPGPGLLKVRVILPAHAPPERYTIEIINKATKAVEISETVNNPPLEFERIYSLPAGGAYAVRVSGEL